MISPKISVTEFVDALSHETTLRKGDLELLSFLYNQPDHKAAVVEIAEVLGKKHHIQINSAFGSLGIRISDFLDKEELFDFAGWYLIATGHKESNYFVWQLRPNFVKALVKLELVSNQTYQPRAGKEDFYEGIRRRVSFDIYERNREARNKCIQLHNATCQLCGFNGIKEYGPIGEGIIHAHHAQSFKENKQIRKTNPEKDLIALCPNCHFLIHKKDPPYTLDEIKKITEKYRKRNVV